MAYLEEMHKDILSGITQNIETGCEIETEQTSLFSYMQSAFQVSNTRHNELIRAVSQKGLFAKCLKFYVNEAKELKPKCADTLCNPFVVLYFQSTPSQQFSSSIQMNTTNPTWDEYISIPMKCVSKDDECLVVEVWNSKQNNTLNKKKTKIVERQNSRLSKLMKDINISSSTVNDLIGRCSIPLETMPTLNQWQTLCRNDKSKSRGEIKLQLTVDDRPKNDRMMIKEHKCLVQILLRHELKTSTIDALHWSGEFSSQATTILQQHILLNEITSNESLIAQWSAFTKVHVDQAFPLSIFNNLLVNLSDYINSTEISADEINMFWDGVKELLPSCFAVIRNLRMECDNILKDSLLILSSIANISPPNGFDLFPKVVYGWLIKSHNDLSKINIYTAIKEAIRSRAQDFLFEISEFRNVHRQNDTKNLQNVMKVIASIDADLEHGFKHYRHLFKQHVQCDYTAISYVYYENELSESINLTIQQACKRIVAVDEQSNLSDSEMTTVLFSVYSMLKRFSALGSQLYAEGNVCTVSSYYEWFVDGVANKLDIMYRNALHRIEKAIELDQMTPVDAAVNHSSSAIDVVAIFHPIKSFWLQLDWPDIESGYSFLAKIVNDICRCCVHYVTKLLENIQTRHLKRSDGASKLIATREQCLAINNIEYVRNSLPKFLEELGLHEMIAKLIDYRSRSDSQRCEETLKSFVDNALDTKENHIFDLIQMAAKHICSTIHTLLAHALHDTQQHCRFIDDLKSYVEELVQILNSNLKTVHFERVVSIIVDETANNFYELIQPNSDAKHLPQSLRNLHECLRSLDNHLSFEKRCNIFTEIDEYLQLHGCESSQLIHLYYTRRYEEQQKLVDAPFGKLTICGHFNEYNYLELKILNARDLVSNSASAQCNPYVQIQLIPNAAIKYDATIK